MQGKRSINKFFGFTLLELIVVMVIIAIVYGAATTVSGNTNWQAVHGQTERLASDVRYMRSMAMQLSQPTRISFPTDTTYEFRATNDAESSLLWQHSENSADVTLEDGVTMSFTGFALTPDPTILVFDPRGVPYAEVDGSFNPAAPLTGDAIVTLTKGDVSQEVVVIPETGAVTIENP